MFRNGFLFGALLCHACLLPAAAADMGDAVTAYPASFFADARPSTAGDMVSRLPGFTMVSGNGARGFAGAGGNVLIDGAPPTAKNDDLTTILSRIPARSVDHIDVIRGGAPGIDMQGNNVIANVVLRADAAAQLIVTAGVTWLESGQYNPAVGIEYHDQFGAVQYEVAAARTVQVWNDGPGTGYRVVTAAGGTPVYDRADTWGIIRLGYTGHAAATMPLWGGEWSNNVTLQMGDFPSGVAYDGGGGSRFESVARDRKGEFGSHWQGVLGAFNLEMLGLQRLGHSEGSNSSATPAGSALFVSSSDTTESIGRATARTNLTPTLALQSGGEVTYNVLQGHSAYSANGVAIALPNANVTVDEVRGEVFATATWKIDPALSLEGGARLEFSRIAESGDSAIARSFFYPKPRLLLSWSADDQTQFRFRVEQVLGQLNFLDFVASSNFSGFGVAAGNASLRPDQRWQLEATAERRLWDKGAIVLDLLHEEISDLRDYIPVGGNLDAPGNIAHAVNDKFAITGTIPLDFLGLHNGLLKPNLYWQNNSLVDPVTGERRRISGQRNINSYYEISQDLDEWKSTWGISFATSFSYTNWRITQIGRTDIHNNPLLNAYWTYKPTPDWQIKLGADNFLPYRLEQQQINYSAPRNIAPAPSTQDVIVRTRPRLYLQLRATL